MPAFALIVVVAILSTNMTMSMLAVTPQAIAATPLAVQPTSTSAVSPASLAEDHAWTLSDIAMEHPGQTSALADGMIVRYLLRGSVSTTGGTDTKEGTLQLVVSAFQPNHDMPGQRAGRWYIRGDWSITDSQAPSPMRGQRHRRGELAGTLVSELDANPFAATDAFTLPLQLPMTLTDAGWVLGKGTLTLNDTRGGGAIALVVSRRGAVVRPASEAP
jgi:hypothetical protein